MKSRTDHQGLSALFPNELSELISQEPSFRGRQLFTWFSSGTFKFDEMKNLPAALRRSLIDRYGETACTSKVVKQQTDADGTVKLLIKLHDGLFVESVLLIDEEGRKTACISSQIGCAMGCTFCRTAELGLERNLTASEIVEQFYHLSEIAGQPSHIVFMGMGEPLANIYETARSIEIFHFSEGLNISARRITLSTCGIPDGIRFLAESLSVPIRLAVSLTSADNDLRTRLMPINSRAPLPELHEALLHYQNIRKKRITLEYVLLGGVNDSDAACRQLVQFARDLECVVNVIPWNPGAGLPYNEPSKNSTERFCSCVEHAGLRVTRRYRRGRGISGACGQLAGTGSSLHHIHPVTKLNEQI
ncbi:MAG: 23S rRNA (adenine(2503)-C(2))-methyltransferase RlmN [Spirochaetia bacterium]|nr:23S rRNA (adenine(2503)-C(2))-methyltransferase RlmN [Spirochaetia bacterium]